MHFVFVCAQISCVAGFKRRTLTQGLAPVVRSLIDTPASEFPTTTLLSTLTFAPAVTVSPFALLFLTSLCATCPVAPLPYQGATGQVHVTCAHVSMLISEDASSMLTRPHLCMCDFALATATTDLYAYSRQRVRVHGTLQHPKGALLATDHPRSLRALDLSRHEHSRTTIHEPASAPVEDASLQLHMRVAAVRQAIVTVAAIFTTHPECDVFQSAGSSRDGDRGGIDCLDAHTRRMR
jgi:hypothetical protein